MIETRAIGVDFGTSTSLVAERDGAERAEILPLGFELRTRYLPSVAALRGGKIVLAEQADSRRSDAVIRSIKRGITENREVIDVVTTDGRVQVSVDEVVLGLLTEIASRTRAQGLPLEEEPLVRLGCPAMWTGPQRRRLIGLARAAGIPVSHATLVDEPVAAGVAWLAHRYLAHRDAPEGRVLVFDMGGGTLDIAVLDVVGGEKPDVTVLAAIGLAEAGDDLDRTMVREFEADLEDRGFDLRHHPDAVELRGELLDQARSTKIALSAQLQRTVVLDAERFGGMATIEYGRVQLEEAFEPQLARAEQMVWAALRAARLTEEFAPKEGAPGGAEITAITPDELRHLGPDDLARDVKYVVLAGGMSRIPAVARRLGELLGKAELHERIGDFLSDEVVVAGLADTAGYDKISLHRPAFDFVLEWDDKQMGGKQRRMLYEAYTPLYDQHQVALGNTFLGHSDHARYPQVPREGMGVIRVLSPTGDPVQLEVDHSVMDGFQVRFGGRPFSFKIYCGGTILVSDGVGKRHTMRVDTWPVVRGHDYAVKLLLTQIPEESDPMLPWYYNDPEDDRPYG
jgi:molecular chaperone DnaK (HSP70)